MRKLLAMLLLGSLSLGGSASAAPMDVATDILVSVNLEGLPPIGFATNGTVTVDGSTVSIAAGVISLGTTVVVPVTATTAFSAITVLAFSNQAATFNVGGVSSQAPGALCPGGGPAVGSACNVGGGFGGAMGINGTINVRLDENIVIPVDLDLAGVGVGASADVGPFVIDNGAWSTGQAIINSGLGIGTSQGGAAPLTLVTPIHVNALGNVLPVFATLTFLDVSVSVPEPSALALAWAGLFGLVALARRR